MHHPSVQTQATEPPFAPARPVPSWSTAAVQGRAHACPIDGLPSSRPSPRDGPIGHRGADPAWSFA